jgi:hypothetical protein
MSKIVQAIDVLFLCSPKLWVIQQLRHGKIGIYYLRTWNLELVIGSHDLCPVHFIFEGF